MYKLHAAMAALGLLGCVVHAQDIYVDNVVIVLDASGSMKSSMRGTSTPKIDAARNAIKQVTATIPQSTRLGLLVFGGGADKWVYPLGLRDDQKLTAAMERVSAGGGTPLGAYMKRGADRLLEARKEQYGYGSYRLLIVTDGEASDEQLVEAYTPDIVSRGIVVDVIGVDMARDHTLATKVHSYRRANDPTTLRQAIQEVFAEVGKATNGQSSESAFDELSGLSEEVAAAMIAALISSGNQPVGSRPASDRVSSVPSRPPQNAPLPKPPQSGRKTVGGRWIVVAAVVAMVLIKTMRGGRRR